MKRWWIVICPTKRRDDIEENIKRNKFDIKTYYPLVKVATTRNGIVKVSEQPLFYNYGFWYYSRDKLPYEHLHQYLPFRLLKLGGMVRSVSTVNIGRMASKVKRINLGFDMMRNSAIHLEKFIGRTVNVHDGVFSGMVGKIVGVKRAGVLVIELVVFNRPMACEVSMEYVEIVSQA